MNTQETKYQRAKKQVQELRDFYTHLIAYVVINAFLFVLDIIGTPGKLWFYWPALGWGIAVALHAVSVFSSRRPLDKDWEEKKIAELMDE